MFVVELVELIDSELRRVLKSSGSLWLNLGDKYAGSGGHNNSGLPNQDGPIIGTELASRRNAPNRYKQTDFARRKSLLGLPWRVAIGLIDRGWILRRDQIWSKPNGLPESVTDRTRTAHEYWFHFTLEPTYFAAVDEIREPHGDWLGSRDAAHRARAGRSYREGDVAGVRPHTFKLEQMGHPLGRLPGSVWTIPTDPLLIPEEVRTRLGLVDHFAAFPQEWPRRLILGWSPEGGTVLDPFGGTGTTAGVARILGRHGISVDLSADYCELAQWRIFESGQFTKSEKRTWADRQTTLD